jgi:hypothetical protein
MVPKPRRKSPFSVTGSAENQSNMTKGTGARRLLGLSDSLAEHRASATGAGAGRAAETMIASHDFAIVDLTWMKVPQK